MRLAVYNRFGRVGQAQFRRTGFSEQDEAGPFQPADVGAVMIGHRILPYAAAGRGDGAVEILAQILQCEWHAVKRSGGQAGADLRFGAVEEEMAEGVQLRL